MLRFSHAGLTTRNQTENLNKSIFVLSSSHYVLFVKEWSKCFIYCKYEIWGKLRSPVLQNYGFVCGRQNR